MVNFTIEQIRSIMDRQSNIRNMSVIAHVDHGKTTVSDALVEKAGIISKEAAGKTCYMSARKDEQERGITIKSTGVSMHYQYEIKGTKQEYLINLIDSPGHVDFSSQVTAALRVTDGALVIVDAVEGVSVQTETVLRQAMQQKIKPVLMINKVDRQIQEQKLDGQSIYQKFIRTIDMVNVIISTYVQEDMGSMDIDPQIGNVAFGSGKEQWGFTLPTFARIYAKKFNTDEDKLLKKLWGDNYFDSETKKWRTESELANSHPLKRAFVQFIMDPIIELVDAILMSKQEQLQKMLVILQLTLPKNAKQLKPKQLLKSIMNSWLNAADTLLEMMILHLPSPQVAQKYRTSYLYEGPQDDECAIAMRNCDPKGPLMIYISKMVPADKGRFYAFGRVFSGTVTSGQKVKIMGANYKFGTKDDVFEKNIQRTVLLMGRTVEYLPSVPCGNTVALVGIDNYLLKTGTISDYPNSYPIRSMKYSVSAVVRVAVAPKFPADLQKLVQGLNKLEKSDPLVKCTIQETGEYVIAGCGELHIEICLKDLREDFARCEIVCSDPVVTYRETVTANSSKNLLTKSGNKLNRIFADSYTMDQSLQEQIERGLLSMIDQDIKTVANTLVEEFGWEKQEALKIYCFGPENKGPNILVDGTKGLQHMNQIKDSIISGFQIVTKSGVLINETITGLRVNITDCTIHQDPVHRGDSQILPAARRLYYACELASDPNLLEPIYLCDITTPMQALGGVYSCLNTRRAQIFQEQQIAGTPLMLVKAYLPVAESFGFTGSLRSMTQGKAFPQCTFDHWKILDDQPYEKGSKTEALVKQIRKRKGMKQQMPLVQHYADKL